MYKLEHLAENNEFLCEFNLQKFFSSKVNFDEKYKEGEPCAVKAEYKVSDKYNDYWMCRKHLYSLFPTVWEILKKEEDQKTRKITRNKT
jgi:hypothetical protein